MREIGSVLSGCSELGLPRSRCSSRYALVTVAFRTPKQERGLLAALDQVPSGAFPGGVHRARGGVIDGGSFVVGRVAEP